MSGLDFSSSTGLEIGRREEEMSETPVLTLWGPSKPGGGVQMGHAQFQVLFSLLGVWEPSCVMVSEQCLEGWTLALLRSPTSGPSPQGEELE
jgi:hypothetical protein